MNRSSKKLAGLTVNPRFSSKFHCLQEAGYCDGCGGFGPYTFVQIINEKLADEWGLGPKERRAYSARESMYCAFCGCSYRLRLLARAVRKWIVQDDKARSLEEIALTPAAQKLKIAEINSCGVLHEILKKFPALAYSEYGSKDSSIPHQDLQQLTYGDNSFDLVLTSDSLEHVPDPALALKETYRILKPGGSHIMTVPIRFNTTTKQRVKPNSNGEPAFLEPKSYHGSGEPDYLVWNEFGDDFLDMVNAAGFDASFAFVNLGNLKDPSGVIIATKPEVPARRKKQQPATVELSYKADADELAKFKVVYPGFAMANKVFIDEPVVPDPIRQVQKIGDLKRKLDLTNVHANNLQIQVDDLLKQYDKLSKDIGILQTELKEFGDSRVLRALNKLTAIKHRTQK